VDRLVAEAAKKAEAEKKAAELEARYAALITSADKAYDGKKLSEALNDYKDALGLKPNEAHPKERIAAIEQQLDAAARAKAEEERLLREKQDRDKRYADLVAAADKAFAAKQYEAARTDYQAASGVKPEERQPVDRIAEIARLLGDAAKKAEADLLAAEAAAAEKARKAEAKRARSPADDALACHIAASNFFSGTKPASPPLVESGGSVRGFAATAFGRGRSSHHVAAHRLDGSPAQFAPSFQGCQKCRIAQRVLPEARLGNATGRAERQDLSMEVGMFGFAAHGPIVGYFLVGSNWKVPIGHVICE